MNSVPYPSVCFLWEHMEELSPEFKIAKEKNRKRGVKFHDVLSAGRTSIVKDVTVHEQQGWEKYVYHPLRDTYMYIFLVLHSKVCTGRVYVKGGAKRIPSGLYRQPSWQTPTSHPLAPSSSPLSLARHLFPVTEISTVSYKSSQLGKQPKVLFSDYQRRIELPLN